MTNAFSVLSLKRNRSTSTCKTASMAEPVSKLSRLKSGFSIFSKFSNSAQSPHNQDKQQPHYHQYHHSTKTNENKHNSFIDFLNHYFRTTITTTTTTTNMTTDDIVNKKNSRHLLRRKNTYESDKNYEYNQYRQASRKKKLALNAERNMYTVPTPKKLKSILIKNGQSRSAMATTTPATAVADTFLIAETSIPIRYSNTTNDLYSNATMNSEDLTAKEFADIAGIRILPEDEEYTEEYQQQEHQQQQNFNEATSTTDDEMILTMSSPTSSFFGKNSYDDHHLTIISHVSQSSKGESFQQQPKIWDNEFWLKPEGEACNSRIASRNNSCRRDNIILEPVLESSTTTTTTTTTSASSAEPPILHELRRMGTCSSDKSGVIKKGRFEIHLNAANDNNPEEIPSVVTCSDSFSEQRGSVLEWKRKIKK